jgi:hypothetical protein
MFKNDLGNVLLRRPKTIKRGVATPSRTYITFLPLRYDAAQERIARILGTKDHTRTS